MCFHITFLLAFIAWKPNRKGLRFFKAETSAEDTIMICRLAKVVQNKIIAPSENLKLFLEPVEARIELKDFDKGYIIKNSFISSACVQGLYSYCVTCK